MLAVGRVEQGGSTGPAMAPKPMGRGVIQGSSTKMRRSMKGSWWNICEVEDDAVQAHQEEMDGDMEIPGDHEQ